MRATIIVRKPDGSIAQLVDISSVDDVTVDQVTRELQEAYGPLYFIDTQQVDAAKHAAMAA